MKLERLGIGVSMVCAAHCAAAPLAAGLLASLAPRHGGEWLEGALLGSVAVLGAATLGPGFRRHRRALPLLLFSLGLGLVVLGHWFGAAGWETATALAGAAGLVGAQLINRSSAAACCGAGVGASAEAAASQPPRGIAACPSRTT